MNTHPLEPLRTHPVFALADHLAEYLGVARDFIHFAEFLSLAAGRMAIPINLDIYSDQWTADLHMANAILDLLRENTRRIETYKQFQALESTGFNDVAVILVRGYHRVMYRSFSEFMCHVAQGEGELPSLWRVADLYVYFYELGLRLLSPGGLLSFVVTNKWMKSRYGEPLLRLFGEAAWMQSVVDFGHAKRIFEDADVFPSIVVARRPDDRPKPNTAKACPIPREQLQVDDLGTQIEEGVYDIELTELEGDGWQLEPKAVADLLAKLRDRGVPLSEYAGASPLMGIKTGFNQAFLIDTPTRNEPS